MTASWFIADLHLTPEEPAGMRAFARLAAAVAPGDTLWILGDLFEFWAGSGHAALPDYRPVLEAMTSCRGSVRFMPGNRDFLFAEPGAPKELLVEEQGLRLYLAHGDFLCPNDKAYLRAAAVLRNPVSLWIARHLPFSLAYKGAAAFRNHSEAKRGRGPAPAGTYELSETMLAEKAAQFQAGHLIVGHVHAPVDRPVAGSQATLHVLDPWHGDAAPYLKLENGVFSRGTL